MPVPSQMSDLSPTAASNSPAGSEAIGNSLDDYLRVQAALLRQTYALASVGIAAASTVNVSASDGESVQITGTGTINSLGTGYNGCKRELRFAGVCTLTHSSNLQLPNAANITTVAGQVYGFRCIGSNTWVLTAASLAGNLAGWQAIAPSAKQDALGFTPVQQGTGVGQLANSVKIGWSAGSKLKATVDVTDLGNVALENWVSSTFAALGGAAFSGAVSTPTLTSPFHISDGGDTRHSYRGGGGAPSRRATVNFSDGGGVDSQGVYSIQRRNTSDAFEANLLTLGLSTGNLNLLGTGTGINWVATSDGRLKDHIAGRRARPHLADDLRFVSFRWRDSGNYDLGLIAQEVERVAAEYVHDSNGTLAVDKASLALEAVIGLSSRVRKLEEACGASL